MERAGPIGRSAEAVQDAAEHFRACRSLPVGAPRDDPPTRLQRAGLVQRHRKDAVFSEAYDLDADPIAVGRLDFTHVAECNGRAFRFNDRADYLGDDARAADRSTNCRLERFGLVGTVECPELPCQRSAKPYSISLSWVFNAPVEFSLSRLEYGATG